MITLVLVIVKNNRGYMKVIVTSVRNEEAWILEWVAYHKALGFDYFLFYTNDNTDGTLELLTKLQETGYVEVIENKLNPDQSPQRIAFNKAFRRLTELNPEWVLCCDVDEYLVLKEQETITDFLKQYSETDAIAFNWSHFGSSGLIKHEDGFTVERFTNRGETSFFMNRMLKSIFKFDSAKLKGFGPHRPWFKDPITPEYIYPSGQLVSSEFWKKGMNLIHDETAPIEHDIACMHHYSIRSLDEYKVKMSRGNGMKANTKAAHFKDDYFNSRDVNSVEDSTAKKLLSKQNEVFKYLSELISK